MRVTAILIAMSFLSPTVLAADKMKPGLWEVTMKSDEMEKMPKLSREQFEQMRSMGIHVPEVQQAGVVTKICITKEMAESGRFPIAQNESDCQARNYRQQGNAYSVDVICKGRNVNGKGKVNAKLNGNENFTSTYRFTGTAHGKPFQQHHERTGRWLSENCGNVKPTDEMPKK